MSNQHGKENAATFAVVACVLGIANPAAASCDASTSAKATFAERVVAMSGRSKDFIRDDASRKREAYRIAQFKNY